MLQDHICFTITYKDYVSCFGSDKETAGTGAFDASTSEERAAK